MVLPKKVCDAVYSDKAYQQYEEPGASSLTLAKAHPDAGRRTVTSNTNTFLPVPDDTS